MKIIVSLLMGLVLFGNQTFAQTSDAVRRMKEVESNLIPFVPVKGFKSWNIVTE